MYDIMPPFFKAHWHTKERRFPTHSETYLHFCLGCIIRAVIVVVCIFVQTSTIVSKVGSLKSQIQELLQRPSDYSFLQAHTNGVVVWWCRGQGFSSGRVTGLRVCEEFLIWSLVWPQECTFVHRLVVVEHHCSTEGANGGPGLRATQKIPRVCKTYLNTCREGFRCFYIFVVSLEMS